MGFMRWLTVSVPGDAGREILLERPGPPAHGRRDRGQVRELVTKGATGGTLIFTHRRLPGDLRDALVAQGVEFTEEPTERPYGIDCGLRDPFGNPIRITQRG